MKARNVADIYALSPAQQGMLLETLAAPGSGIHVEQVAWTLRGDLDPQLFSAAWRCLLERHPVLRTAFVWKDQEEPLQVVFREVELAFELLDWRELGPEEQETRLAERLAAERRQGFDPARAPLMRLALARTGERVWELLWSHHHILMDGWCRPLLLRELLAAYQTLSAGGQPQLGPGFEYGDYIVWLEERDRAAAEAFWRGRLGGIVRATPLGRPGAPGEAGAPAATGDGWGEQKLRLSSAATAQLGHLARRLQVTLGTVVQGLWGLLLARYSGEPRVVFGITVAGRPAELAGVESAVGLFINTLPQVIVCAPEQTLGAWLLALQRESLELRQFEWSSGALVRASCEVPATRPLYESVLVYESYPSELSDLRAGGLELDLRQLRSTGARTRHALTLVVKPGAQLLAQAIHDRRRLGDGETERLLEHLRRLAEAVGDSAELPLARLLETVPEAEIPRLRAVAETGAERAHTPFVPPRSALEEQVAMLWAQVLELETVGVEDNFFELGGHSLLATQLIARLRASFEVEVSLAGLFEAPTVAGQASEIARLRAAGSSEPADRLPVLVPDPEHRLEPFPLTDVQQAYWIGRLDVFEIANVATHFYQEADAEDLDLARLEHAWQRLIERHGMLRAIVTPEGRQQVLEGLPPYQIRVEELAEASEEDRAERLARVRREMSHQVLPADRWPLFEIRACHLGAHRYRLHLSLDLILADGWSWRILLDELTRLYHHPETELAPLALSFRDCVLAELALERSELYRRAEAYWDERLATLPPAPELPLAVDPAKLGRPRFTRLSWRLETERWQQLKERGTRAGITATGLLLAAFSSVLAVWSKSGRFTLNLTLFNRLPLHPEVGRVVGDFTSLTLLEVDARAEQSFVERARAVQRQLWSDLDHRYFGGVRVLRKLARRRGERARALMPIVFTSVLAHPGRRGGERLPIRMAHNITQTPQTFLDHQVSDRYGPLVINWDAVEGLFPAGMLEAMFEAYRGLLERLGADAAAWDEPLLPAPPAAQLERRAAINAAALAPVPAGLLHEPLAAVAGRSPERTAVIAEDRRLSFGELWEESGALALELLARGVLPNQLVAVVMEKGWEQVVAVVAILRAGAAYLPIDAALPAARRHQLLARGEARLALVAERAAGALEWPPGVEPLVVRAGTRAAAPVPSSPAGPRDLAYVIFTSGSTGEPKGVMLEHRAALNTVLDVNQRFGIGAEDRVLALSSLSFDLSVWDVFGVLGAGGAVVLPPPEAGRDPSRWAELLAAHGVTVWNSVPVLLEMLVEHREGRGGGWPGPLRLALLSGDWIPLGLPERVRSLAGAVELVSLGGATEAAIWSIYHRIERVEPDWKSIPYGRPLASQSWHVLDKRLEPRPELVVGELYIGGEGLARGYWRDPERTAASFVTQPQTGARLYRTGDLGRWLPSGEIEFLGREDFQVKIQGYRVELGEIEATLERHPRVRSAVAGVESGAEGKRLIGWVVLEPAGGLGEDLEPLRLWLSERLPAYMVPAQLLALERLPLTANGKLDRAALPRAVSVAAAVRSGFAAPRGELEQTLADVFAEQLGGVQVGRDDQFFDLGATSLTLVRVHRRLEAVLAREVRMVDLFRSGTVAALARALESQAPQAVSTERDGERRDRRQQALLSRQNRRAGRGA